MYKIIILQSYTDFCCGVCCDLFVSVPKDGGSTSQKCPFGVRVYDHDSDENIRVTRFPNFWQALRAYDRVVTVNSMKG